MQVKIQNQNGEYSVLQAAKKLFYFENLLHADLMVADLQFHFNMIRISDVTNFGYRFVDHRSEVSSFCLFFIQIADLTLVD